MLRYCLPILAVIGFWSRGAVADPATDRGRATDADARFDFAIALPPFPYGAFEVNSTHIMNWANGSSPLELKDQAKGLYAVEKQKDIVEEKLADGWLVRYMATDGSAQAFVVRGMLGMNLECKPTSLDAAESADHVAMCLHMRVDAKKLVVPISLGKNRDVRLTRLMKREDERDMQRVSVRVSEATSSDPKTVAAAKPYPKTGKILQRRRVGGGFAVLVQGNDDDERTGETRYEVIVRTKVGGSDLMCTASEASRRLAAIDLDTCLALRRP